MTVSKNTWLGIGCGAVAGAFWGLVFLAPALAKGFTPLQLSAGRYLAYGLLSVALIAPAWPRLARVLTRTEWRALAWLSFWGNILYFVLLARAVQTGGIAMTSLIVGFLPVTVTIVASREHGAVPFARLLPSLMLSSAGMVCIGWHSLQASSEGSLEGLLCALGALASWTVYAVQNSRWLGRLDHVTSHEWSLLTGVVTGAESLLLAVPAFALAPRAHGANEWLYFGAIVTGVAICASVLGNAFWNRASRLLPLTMTGQMILFETLFALLYGFIWEGRAPAPAELAAVALLVAGVLSCTAAHRTPAAAPA
ncbi:DMT family transporter [Massilia solisilvae]|uniref:DMT family transporter n=1 Tax=Massilia solisilvae TaxID=1811225 RepID=A0ABT2BH70_9BURK|nr:DMT family transporter [Massilia solisilvae]